jgi:hypothetical protein
MYVLNLVTLAPGSISGVRIKLIKEWVSGQGELTFGGLVAHEGGQWTSG